MTHEHHDRDVIVTGGDGGGTSVGMIVGIIVAVLIVLALIWWFAFGGGLEGQPTEIEINPPDQPVEIQPPDQPGG